MARRATSLGPRPSLFVFVVFFGGFLSTKKTLFSPKKRAVLFIFSVSLSFSLSLFWPPSFSVSLSLFSLFFFSFFLPSCLSFLLSFGSVFFVSFFLFLSSLLFFPERNHIKILNCKFCLHPYFLFFLVSCLFLFQVPFSYLCSFLILSYVFVQHQGFWFPNKQLKKKHSFVKRGVATKRFFFFINLCFGKCQKLSFFFCLPFFWQFLGDVQKIL